MRTIHYLSAALFGALMLAPVSDPACNGNGNCENAPGHNKFQGRRVRLSALACLFLR